MKNIRKSLDEMMGFFLEKSKDLCPATFLLEVIAGEMQDYGNSSETVDVHSVVHGSSICTYSFVAKERV